MWPVSDNKCQVYNFRVKDFLVSAKQVPLGNGRLDWAVIIW